MSKTHLTQIWQALSILCVLFLITSVISLQGGSEFLGRLFGDKAGNAGDNASAVGYFGAIIGSGLLLLSSAALWLYAKRHGTSWHSRIPVVWLKGLNTSAREGKIFQFSVLIVFIVIPIVGILRSMEVAEAGDICELNTNTFYRGSETTLLWPPTAEQGEQMRLQKQDFGGKPCIGGVELFPRSLTPLGFYGVPLAATILTIFALTSVFRSSEQIKADQENDESV
ncbi:hypothetical protein [Roseibium marinum]|uniref:Uncharacterized protein n=1 Tax=Roseibium marinum TaxID=281252 RepID=A0A2S3US18_9HYPH|nr:hypothetical protein [Roseibium marinum]POF30511.1 hypothetical protein CLV41_106125 [Roseibium marinum]